MTAPARSFWGVNWTGTPRPLKRVWWLDANRAFNAPLKASGLQFFSPSVAARSQIALNFFDRSPTLYPVTFGEETTTPTSTIFTPVRLNAVGLEKVSLVI